MKWFSDSEAWSVIGDMVEFSNHLTGKSLCLTLIQATRHRILEPCQWLRMEEQMYKMFCKDHPLYKKNRLTHLWPPHDVKRAVRICRKLALKLA